MHEDMVDEMSQWALQILYADS